MERGESFGGPSDVPVTRHPRGAGPLVRLRHDPSCTGRILRQGPSQSIVRWTNGNEDCVVNAWIERIEEVTLLGAKAGKVVVIQAPPEHGVVVTQSTIETIKAPKPRKEPDALARRVSEFDDAEVRAFATANGCWDDKYLALPNLGLRRMNIMNRLRAKLKREPEYQVKW